MPKRLTDTDLWDKEWFMALPPRLKCAVKLIRDKCDLAGVWSPNWTLLKMYVGEAISEEEVLGIDGGAQFSKMPCGKIFCIGFVEFQNGQLGNSSPVHKKISSLLKLHKIEHNAKLGYLYPISSLIVEVGERVKVESFGKEGLEENPFPPIPENPELPERNDAEILKRKLEAEYQFMDSAAVANCRGIVIAGRHQDYDYLFAKFTEHYKALGEEVTEMKHGTLFSHLGDFMALAVGDLQARVEAGVSKAQTPQNYLKGENGERGWRRDIHRGKNPSANGGAFVPTGDGYQKAAKSSDVKERNDYMEKARAAGYVPVVVYKRPGDPSSAVIVDFVKANVPQPNLIPKKEGDKLLSYSRP